MWDAPIQIPRSLQCTKVWVHLPLTHCRIARQLGSGSYICILTVIELKVCGKLGFFVLSFFVLLSSQLPKFFCEAINFDVYHKNITFVNDITGMTTRSGIDLMTQFSWFKCSFQNQFLTHLCIIFAYQENNDLERECWSEISEPH